MKHIVYRTTCEVTGRYYLGRHSTNNLEDGYLGSGTIIRRSIKKHGADKHVREVLGTFETFEECVAAEVKLITEEVLADPLCMNISAGGPGPNGYRWSEESKLKASRAQLGKTKSAEARAKMSEFQKSRPRRPMTQEEKDHLSALNKGQSGKWKHSEESRKKISQVQIGRKHSEETKRKMREAHARRLHAALLDQV